MRQPICENIVIVCQIDVFFTITLYIRLYSLQAWTYEYMRNKRKGAFHSRCRTKTTLNLIHILFINVNTIGLGP